MTIHPHICPAKYSDGSYLKEGKAIKSTECGSADELSYVVTVSGSVCYTAWDSPSVTSHGSQIRIQSSLYMLLLYVSHFSREFNEDDYDDYMLQIRLKRKPSCRN